jgi:hypothetical protein
LLSCVAKSGQHLPKDMKSIRTSHAKIFPVKKGVSIAAGLTLPPSGHTVRCWRSEVRQFIQHSVHLQMKIKV